MAVGGISYLFGWSKPAKIGKSSPLVKKALQRIVERYAQEGADKARRYCPVDTSLLQKSITAQPDMTEKLLYWVGSDLPYMAKIEWLWSLGMPASKNRNSSASSHCISRGVNDIKKDFQKACGHAMKGEWGSL